MEGLGEQRLTRRSVLGGAASLALGLAAGLSAGGTSPSWSAPRGHGSPGATDWRGLAGELQGVVLRPGAALYPTAVRTFDPRRDGVTPLAVVQVAGESDVVRTLAFAAHFGLAVRPRSGGHSYVGASTGNGVVVLDTGPLHSVGLNAA